MTSVIKTPLPPHRLQDSTLLQLSMSWQQSPPMAIPMMATHRSAASTDLTHTEPTIPQLSFEAREGQMLVQAYAANARIGAEYAKHETDSSSSTPRPSSLSSDLDAADNLSLPDDDQDVFSMEL
ncbi:hypothetical protein H257_13948 [Aphanomyces astaci]|uniref:Uncharacterized protein n=1 Tax=Aphanomyces astaci TaxID=112090 RepID=W4FUW2_APHAT|nr:hypothetical protein H257_13948 [Aphanomyces astaci]ETV70569.1 hypothetical protein H257_13948 [Aphanomyces astaci]RHY99643.1 hypothetical protein DYB35_010744 [Aphanomyces astaci]RHZ04187.1 hypothetical protein DYB37_006496 [Aphanomyces astaci]RQM27071.1 hypothetical protein B5M09_002262 [Aphanomyces astaci]|eukprot:XP_009839952.1 hypothetical protein H257_13948 [Aphanomyces astaci]